MIRHVVLIKSQHPEQVDEVLERLPELVGVVPGLPSVEWGRNFSERSQGYDRLFILNFESREALAGWGPHPAHQPIRSRLTALSSMMVIDYEV